MSKNEEQEAEPIPGDWCMDCGLFPGLDGRCSECGRDVSDFKGARDGEYCLKCGKKMEFTCWQCSAANKAADEADNAKEIVEGYIESMRRDDFFDREDSDGNDY